MKKFSKKSLQIISSSQIFLIVMSLFAFAVILNEGEKVSGQAIVPATAPNPVTIYDGIERFHPGLYETSSVGAAPPPPTTPVQTEGSLLNPAGFFGVTEPFLVGIINGAAHGLAIGLGIQFVGPMLGLSEETTDALSISAGLGVFSGEAVKGYLASNPEFLANTFGKNFIGDLSATQAGWAAGIGVGVVAFILLYKETEKKVVTFSCLPWQPSTGGSHCEECNTQKGGLPCSEYQCKSLGQSCELVNKGTTEEKCVWVNRQDVNPPTITPMASALENNFKYSPDNAINPPDRGVKIENFQSRDVCIPAFTPLRFGVELNEPAKCKIDILRKQDFESMEFFMSGGLLRYNHTYALSLPGKNSVEGENITLINDGNYELYVRCEDANGNSNTANFVFKYCVDPGPDTTPPLIVTTNIKNKAPVAFNKNSVDIEVFTNEPAQCRWSHNNKDYDTMTEQMTCSSSIFDFNAQSLYKCSTTLTGLKDKTENKFYFRCKDKPNAPENERNANEESYEFSLIGTQPIVIDSVTPDNETIKDSTDSIKVPIKVKTSAGFNKGEAICYYSPTGKEGSYIKFFDTGGFEHSQDLFLTEGDYDYFIRCTDLGGNSDNEEIDFDVETDTSVPSVVRAFREENFLKIITSEEAECRYSTFSCNYLFDEGTLLTVADKKNHFTDWNAQKDLFIKCRDGFGNEPLPDRCSITVQGNDF
ncbi:MAG TPA: hypothetical protein VJZ93_02955 [Candidatus Nanoarchaeia archaeon]|nr:hypothetical protein [Candidatus Nanoarchaeia archaeon]